MKFFAIILSLQLIMSPIGFAATPDTKTNPTQPAPSVKDANNVASPANPVYDGNSQVKSGGFEFYGKQALSIANAIIGSNIISQCSFGMKLTSINLFWAGTIAYIASEISAGGKDQNSDQNQYQSKVDQTAEELRKLKGGGDGDVQRQIIEKRLADEKRTSKFISDRVTWLTAVMAIYTAAAAAAIMEETSGVATGAGVGTGVCQGIASARAAIECAGKKHYPACYAAKYAKHMGACTASMPAGWAQTLPNFYRPDSVAIAQASCAGLYAPACTAYLQTYLGLAYANCTPFAPGAVVMGISLARIITAAYSMAINAAGGNGISTNIVMMYNLLEFFIPSLAKNIMPAYNYPIPRAVTFGALAALVGMIISGLKQRQQNIIQPNIEKLTLLRDDFVATTSVPGGLNNYTPPEVNPAIAVQKSKDLPPNYKFPTAKPLPKVSVRSSTYCVASDNSQLDFTDKGCTKPLVIPKVNIPTVKIPAAEAINRTNEMGIEMANEISRGNIDEAKGIAAQIGDMMGPVQEAYSQAQANMNKNREAEGIAPYDFKNSTSNELARLNDEYKGLINGNDKLAALKNSDLGLGSLQGQGPGISPSAVGSASVSESIATSAAAVPEVKQPDAIGVKSAVGDQGGGEDGANGAGGVAAEAGILADIENSVGGDGSQLNQDDLSAARYDDLKSAELNGYTDLDERLKMYSNKNDGISPITDFSLFKQISYRYHKSLDKVLVRKKKPLIEEQLQKKKTK